MLGYESKSKSLFALGVVGSVIHIAVLALLRLSRAIATSTEIAVLRRVLSFVMLPLIGASVLTIRDTNFSVAAAVLFIAWGLTGLGNPLIYDIATQLWNIGQLVAVSLANLPYLLLQLR